ncbi:hypothetical protein ACH6CV_13685 [Bacillota bacterium Meth-B3]
MQCYLKATSGRISPFFRATAADATEPGNCRLSEELMYTQSNARVLLGHTPGGQMRFLSLPTVVYPVPVMHSERTVAIDYYPGTYYQCDQVLFLGNLRYELELEDGERVSAIERGWSNHTGYISDALPVSFAGHHGLEIRVSSCAPVAREGKAMMASAPLPGPTGALFTMHVKNTSSERRVLRVHLRCDPIMIDTYRFEDKPLPPHPGEPQRYIRQETMIFVKPEGCAGIHMRHGQWTGTEGQPDCVRPLALESGEEALVEAQVALAKEYHELMPAIYELSMRGSGEWLLDTVDFWASLLGELSLGADPLMQKACDLYVRCVIDNFNCLQLNGKGDLISHWQGAPAHNCGTIWGIDIEPTALSVLPVCPELCFKVLEFFAERSRCPAPRYPDHSTPILIAPLLLAGAYYRATGDAEAFVRRPALVRALDSVLEELLSFQAADCVLFSSHYSSDAHVFRKYDHGTNVKVQGALSLYAGLLEALGQKERAGALLSLAADVRTALFDKMSAEGPFGTQFSGGTNLGGGDEDGFYLPDGTLYYDGEDSASCMAPVYGAYGWNQSEWINYHRFARSLWCPNFDAEFSADRWFHDGGPLDGTAFISRVGGSHTRREMREALEALFAQDCDETGSVYWWPLGSDACRGITRCSQGQGSWAQQFVWQWVGVSLDVPARRLSVAPAGLPEVVVWRGMNLGGHRFDLKWEQAGGEIHLELRNLGGFEWTVELMGAAPAVLAPGGSLSLSAPLPVVEYDGIDGEADIVARELGSFACEHGILFDSFDKKLVRQRMWDGEMWSLVRLVVASGEPIADAKVSLALPEGWQVVAKPARLWVLPERLMETRAETELGDVEPNRRAVAAFWVRPPKASGFEPRFDAHSFAERPSTVLVVGAGKGEMRAVLSSTMGENPIVGEKLWALQ